MKIDIIESSLTSNCYIIHTINGAYIIDPSVSSKTINKYLNENEKVIAVLITHAHMDHIFYLDEVTSFFNVKVYTHKNSIDLIYDNKKNYGLSFGVKEVIKLNKENLILLNDNDKIDDIFKVYYTPGHTHDCVCYLIEDCLFTGDTLFSNTVGRTDLYSGNTKLLMDSLKKIFKLGDKTIYPGHGESASLKLQVITNPYMRKAILG